MTFLPMHNPHFSNISIHLEYYAYVATKHLFIFMNMKKYPTTKSHLGEQWEFYMKKNGYKRLILVKIQGKPLGSLWKSGACLW